MSQPAIDASSRGSIRAGSRRRRTDSIMVVPSDEPYARGADAVPPPGLSAAESLLPLDTAGTGITSRHAGQRILFPAALSGAFKVFLQLEQITIMGGAMLTQDKMIADQ